MDRAKIKYYMDKKVRQEIDDILKKMSSVMAGTGTDTTPEEWQEIDQEYDSLQEKIKDLDPEFYKQLVPYENK